jgi:hypothetical protein
LPTDFLFCCFHERLTKRLTGSQNYRRSGGAHCWMVSIY